MSFRIRKAVAADIKTVLQLAVDMVLTSRSDLRPEVPDEAILQARRNNLSQLEDILDLPEGGLFVAVDDRDQVIGHVILMGNNIDSVTELPQAWVYDLSVHREWWGRGVGRRLMQVAEEFALSLGLDWIGLGVTASNQRALGFYEEIGYRKERFQMAKRLEKTSP
jgi:ribosomal protein S18 acetylase RimI-like enzyme